MKEKIIKLLEDGKTYKEISNELNCAKSTISYYSNKYNIISKNKNMEVSEELIKKINELYKQDKSSYEISKILEISKSTALKYVKKENIRKKIERSDSYKKSYKSEYIKKWKKELKRKLVEYKGGKCELCGYNKCIEALEFHHKDPTKKDFTISLNLYGFEQTKKEVDKCIMVCSNCHREVHYL